MTSWRPLTRGTEVPCAQTAVLEFKFNEAVSFFISVETQQDVDYFWSQLTADGGKPSQSGWLKDKFGLS